MSETGLSHTLPGGRDQSLDEFTSMLRAPLPPASTAFTLGIVRVWNCGLCPLLLFSDLFFRTNQRSIRAGTGHLHSLFVCFYFLKDFFLAMISIKINT